MRVLFVTHSYPRHVGDAPGSFLLRLARALRDVDVDVRVLAPAAAGLARRESIDGIDVARVRYGPRSWETLAYGGEMAEQVRATWRGRLALAGLLAATAGATMLRARRVDVVHAHWWFPGGLSVAPAAAALRVPLVTTLHGTDVRIARDVAPARAAFRRVLGASAAVTAVSRWLAERTTELAPAAHPVVAPMPVATELFAPGGEQGRDGLLFVGRLTAQKGVDRLLRTLTVMRRDTALTVVGDGPERASLHALAGELGIADRVTWLGALAQPALAEHYRRAAALVVPSHEEGLGLVAVEAALCGTPVVAFDSGGLRDVVHDGETGLLVPPGDVGALAVALDALLADGAADRRARLGAVARERALASFAPESVAARYANIYRAVARGDRP